MDLIAIAHRPFPARNFALASLLRSAADPTSGHPPAYRTSLLLDSFEGDTAPWGRHVDTVLEVHPGTTSATIPKGDGAAPSSHTTHAAGSAANLGKTVCCCRVTCACVSR